jgi:hypothetical protein
LAAQTASDEKTVERLNCELAPAGETPDEGPVKGSRRAPCQRKTSRAALAVALTRYDGEAVSVAWVEHSVSCVKPGW